MLSRPELRQLRQRIVLRYELRPFSAEETGRYVRGAAAPRRLHGQGAVQVAARCSAVHQLTGGVPRLINILCDGALLLGFARDRSTVGADEVREVAQDLGLTPRPASRRRGTTNPLFADGRACSACSARAKHGVRDGQGLRCPATGGGAARAPRRRARRCGDRRRSSIPRRSRRTGRSSRRARAVRSGAAGSQLRSPGSRRTRAPSTSGASRCCSPSRSSPSSSAALRARIDSLGAEQPLRTIAVTSADAGRRQDDGRDQPRARDVDERRRRGAAGRLRSAPAPGARRRSGCGSKRASRRCCAATRRSRTR